MNQLQKFFWFCSGAYSPLLKKSPSDTHKYIGIGGTVFFTGLLAAIAAGFALFTIFQSLWIALGFGLLWGLMIFNLDRFIVSSIRKSKRTWETWRMAIPRLAFAGLIAVVIAKPLELKIFEREINRELDVKKSAMFEQSKNDLFRAFPEIDLLEIKKDSLKKELLASRAFRDQLQREYDFERFGTKTEGTSGVVGLGINARKKEQQLDAAQRELDLMNLRVERQLDSLDRVMATYLEKRDMAIAERNVNISGFDGLAARLEALHRLGEESTAIYWANIFIMLLFVAIETAPIFVKIISSRGPYDELLDLAEFRVKRYVQEEKLKVNTRKTEMVKKLSPVS